MSSHRGQATLEYVLAIAMTILFIGFLMSQIHEPIKQWWDGIARKVAAPCPGPQCVENADTGPSLTE